MNHKVQAGISGVGRRRTLKITWHARSYDQMHVLNLGRNLMNTSNFIDICGSVQMHPAQLLSGIALIVLIITDLSL